MAEGLAQSHTASSRQGWTRVQASSLGALSPPPDLSSGQREWVSGKGLLDRKHIIFSLKMLIVKM